MNKNIDKNNINEKITHIMSLVFKIDKSKINQESSPDNISRWDSLAHMNLILALEEEFKIKFSNEEIIEFLNFNLIYNIISNKL